MDMVSYSANCQRFAIEFTAFYRYRSVKARLYNLGNQGQAIPG
jgi:hypothetical protein